MLYSLSLIKTRSNLVELNKMGSRQSGFALVVALSLMAFILLLLLGIVTLVQVETRSAATSKQQLESRQAALLSLNLAIGKLQETAGLDQRVTAPVGSVAGIPDVERSKKITGVWRGWEGLNHDKSTGLPEAPDYTIKLNNGDLDIDSANQGRFLSWLTSSYEEAKANSSTVGIADVPPTAEGSDTVPLLAKGTLGESALAEDEVHIRATQLPEESSSYAWWVTGENSKVKLQVAEEVTNNFEATEQMLISPGPSGSEFGLDDVTDVDRVSNRTSLDLLPNSLSSGQASEFFHDVTVSSKGLLTNTANGGWRRDLSLWAENWDDIDEGFSSFTLSPGEIFESGKAHYSASNPEHPLMYLWTDWTPSNSPGTFPSNSGSNFPNSVSWGALADFATQYKKLPSSGNEFSDIKEETNRSHYAWIDTVQRMPVISRIHMSVSLSSRPGSGGQYIPCVIINPVVTFWNPYSVPLDMSHNQRLVSTMRSVVPVELTLTAGGNTSQKIDMHTIVGSDRIDSRFWLNSPAIWMPGEARIFSIVNGNIIERSGNNKTGDRRVNFGLGYHPGSGLRYPLQTELGLHSGSATFSISNATVTANLNLPNIKGVGIYFTNVKEGITGSNSTNNINCALDTDAGVTLGLGSSLPLASGGASASLASLYNTPQPILAALTGLRYGRDISDEFGGVVVNGVHNMNPVIGYMTDGVENSAAAERFDVFPYSMEFFPVADFASDGMPSGIDDELEGYIGGGFDANFGTSNLIALEIPTRPLRTIGDLQHFNVNACNPRAPFTLNAFGNSRASPFIFSDKIQVQEFGGAVPEKTGHDHSYAINHLLLDDWFVSSIAPKTNGWSSGVQQNFQTVYENYRTGQELLPNRYYKPSDVAKNGSSGFSISDDDAWLEVAAELEVEGMFNINSTSEKAWAMLLKRSFESGSASVLTLEDSIRGPAPSGTVSPSVTLDESEGSPFPRSMLTSDEAVGNYPSLVQPHRFTDEEINALAAEIVKEIELRGPFLSLSEFFNRQLLPNADSSDQDTRLARAGALESALLTLAEGGGAANPYDAIQTDFPDQASSTGADGSSLTYPFEAAAEGNPAYGFPGWTRQADVLRPISGILSARDDTLTIRAYGDVRDPVTNEVISQSWCEAVVQRKAEYVDSSDDKYTLPSKSTLDSEVNQYFGRRFEIIDFRWLSEDEV